MTLETLIVRIAADASQLERGITQASGSIQNFAQKAGIGLAAVGAAVTAAAGAAVNVGSAYESAMSQVAATMSMAADKSNEAFAQLSQAAEHAGQTTMFSATQAANALNYLALAGYDAAKAAQALPTVLNLAAAGGLDLAYASDLITDSMSALGIEISQLESFTDALAKTSQKSNTNIAQLGEAILRVGGTAKDMAGGTDELNTVLGLLADNGIKGAEAGTKLRNILLAMTPQTDDAAAAFEQLSLKTYDAEGNLRAMEDIFADINEGLKDMTSEEKTNWINKVFNRTDLSAVQALLGTTAERWDELSEAIKDAEGAASDMAKTMTDNLKGDLTVLNSSLEALGIKFYEHLSEPLRKAAQLGIEATGRLTASLDGIVQTVQKTAPALAALAASFAISGVIGAMSASLTGATAALQAYAVTSGGASVAAGLTTGALKLKTAALAALNGSLSVSAAATGVFTAAAAKLNAVLLANPVGIFAAGLAALGIAVYGAVQHFSKASQEAQKLTRETEKLAETTDRLTESQAANHDAHKARVSDIEKETAAAHSLAKALHDLLEASSDRPEAMVADQLAKVTAHVKLLNEALGENKYAYDEEKRALIDLATGYEITTAEIYSQIEARKEAARAQAAQERAVELTRDQIEVERQLNKLLETNLSALDKWKQGAITYEEYRAILAETGAQTAALRKQQTYLTDAIDYYTDAVVTAEQKTESLADTAEESAARVNLAAKQIENAYSHQAFLTKTLEQVENDLTYAMTRAANERGIALARWTDQTKDDLEYQIQLHKELAQQYLQTSNKPAYDETMLRILDLEAEALTKTAQAEKQAAAERARAAETSSRAADERARAQEAAVQKEISALENLQKEHERIQNAMIAAEKKYQDAVDSRAAQIYNSFGLFDQLRERENEREKAAEKAAAALQTAEDRRGAIYRAREDAEAKTAERIKQIQEDARGAEPEAARRAQEEIKKIQDQAVKDANEYAEQIKTAEKAVKDARCENQAAQKEAAKSEGQVLTERLEAQKNELADWLNNLDALEVQFDGLGLDKGLLAELQKMGPSANKEIAALSKMTDGELKKYADLWQEKHELARKQAVKELEYLRRDTNNEIKDLYRELNSLLDRESPKTGENLVDGIIEGIRNKTSALYNAVADMASAAIDAANEAFDIHSPSRVFRKIGENIIDSFAAAVIKGEHTVESALRKTLLNPLSNPIELRLNTSLGTEGRFLRHSEVRAEPSLLSRNPVPAPASPIQITNHFHGLTVRDESDIDDLAERIKQSLTRDTVNSLIMQGAAL